MNNAAENCGYFFSISDLFKKNLIPPFDDLGMELESAFTFRTKSVLLIFFLAELYLCAKAVGTFKVGQYFLDAAPLFA